MPAVKYSVVRIAGGSVTELQRPKFINHNPDPALVLQRSEKCAITWVKGMDAGVSIPKITDQECAAKDTE